MFNILLNFWKKIIRSKANKIVRNEDRIYQRIGEFVVSYQWIEDRIRTIGWLIIDPNNENFPQKQLRNESSKKLFETFKELLLEALPKCQLVEELELDFRNSLEENTERFHTLRKFRNVVLHSAYNELKAGGEVVGIVRTDPKIKIDNITQEPIFDIELLSDKSFEKEMLELAILALFLNRCRLQLIQRLPRN